MKSGIELLEELLEQVKTLNKRFEITEQNVKLLLKKTNEQEKSSVKIKRHVPKPNKVHEVPPPPSVIGTRVIGKLKDKDGRVLFGKEVKVYNIGDQLVKETKTNRAGEWMCFLPKGLYYVKYQLPEQMPTEIKFQISEGESIMRVASPN